MFNSAPIYRKIEVILNKPISTNEWYNNTIKFDDKNKEEKNLKKISDPIFSNKEKFIFEDSALIITGGYLLITKEEINNENYTEKSTVGRIFDLKDVFLYRAHI